MTDLGVWQASAIVDWFTPEEGGRLAGPPHGATYSPTLVFEAPDPSGSYPEPVHSNDQFSAVFKLGENEGLRTRVDLRLLSLTAIAPMLVAGASLLVMEGPKPVGRAIITAVMPAVGPKQQRDEPLFPDGAE